MTGPNSNQKNCNTISTYSYMPVPVKLLVHPCNVNMHLWACKCQKTASLSIFIKGLVDSAKQEFKVIEITWSYDQIRNILMQAIWKGIKSIHMGMWTLTLIPLYPRRSPRPPATRTNADFRASLMPASSNLMKLSSPNVRTSPDGTCKRT